jgi:hypothetical protein
MAGAARAIGRPGAAETVARDLLALAGLASGSAVQQALAPEPLTPPERAPLVALGGE